MVFCLSRDMIDPESTDITNCNHLLNLVLEYLLRNNTCMANGVPQPWHFYYEFRSDAAQYKDPQYVNLTYKMREYPTQLLDVAHRSLMNRVVRHPEYNALIEVRSSADFRLCFGVDKHFWGNEWYIKTAPVLPLMEELQLIREAMGRGKAGYVITVQGWQKIDELRKQEQTVRQGFVAMAFRDEAKPIRESFREAINDQGYKPVILDEKEHNNQIVPEIFYEIKRSKFVVVDVTYPNYGAYYEAGYAQALGKPVIICCQKQVYDDPAQRPHFDIAQQSIVVWETHEELVNRLKRRIEATVV
jgi:nucleoside 2-deoxyribosyltransferase